MLHNVITKKEMLTIALRGLTIKLYFDNNF